MISRVAIVFALTGIAHVLSILSLKFMALRGSPHQVAGIGEVDSLIQFMIGLIGFGMQSDAIRNIAIDENWQYKYGQAQTARITLAVLLIPVSLIAFSNGVYSCFLVAPLLAISGDYALYGRGFPVAGSIVAFVRVVIPLLTGVTLIIYLPAYLFVGYLIATFFVYLLTNMFISFFLKVNLVYRPMLKSILLYIKTIPLGILNLCFYFFGLGMLLLAQLFYPEKELVILFMGLKFYAVFKGAVRVVHQTFVRHMLDDRVCLNIDKISILIGLLFLGVVSIFPRTFISTFFGEQFIDYPYFFILLALSAITFSLFSSSLTQLVLDHKDYKLMSAAISAVCVATIFVVITVLFSKSIELVGMGLWIGELSFSIVIVINFYDLRAIWNRISFLLLCSVVLTLPLAIRIMFSDNLLSCIISCVLMGLIYLFFNYKNLKLPPNIGNRSLKEVY